MLTLAISTPLLVAGIWAFLLTLMVGPLFLAGWLEERRRAARLRDLLVFPVALGLVANPQREAPGTGFVATLAINRTMQAGCALFLVAFVLLGAGAVR